MRYRITLVVGLAAGYVLGARAGIERYEQIRDACRRFIDTPAVQQVAGVIGAQVAGLADRAKHSVTDRLPGHRFPARPSTGTGWGEPASHSPYGAGAPLSNGTATAGSTTTESG